MTYLKMEQSIIQEVSSNAFRFNENYSNLAGYYFSQYAAREFLKLYFCKSNELEQFDFYVLLINLKSLARELDVLANSIRVVDTNMQIKHFEAQFKNLSIFMNVSPKKGSNPLDIEKLSSMECVKASIDERTDYLVHFLSSIFNCSKQSIDDQVEKLYLINLDFINRTSLSFSGPLTPNDINSREIFTNKVKSNLQEYIGTKEDNFFWKNKYYILGLVIGISALVAWFFPPSAIILGLQIEHFCMILGGLGLAIILFNFGYSFFISDPLEEKYTSLFNKK